MQLAMMAIFTHAGARQGIINFSTHKDHQLGVVVATYRPGACLTPTHTKLSAISKDSGFVLYLLLK